MGILKVLKLTLFTSSFIFAAKPYQLFTKSSMLYAWSIIGAACVAAVASCVLLASAVGFDLLIEMLVGRCADIVGLGAALLPTAGDGVAATVGAVGVVGARGFAAMGDGAGVSGAAVGA